MGSTHSCKKSLRGRGTAEEEEEEKKRRRKITLSYEFIHLIVLQKKKKLRYFFFCLRFFCLTFIKCMPELPASSTQKRQFSWQTLQLLHFVFSLCSFKIIA